MNLTRCDFAFTAENDEGYCTVHGHLKVRTHGRWFWKRKKLKGYASIRSYGKKDKRTGTGSRGVTMTMTFNGAPEKATSWHKSWTKISDEREAILEALHDMTTTATIEAKACRFFSETELYGHAVCSFLFDGKDTPEGLDGAEFFRFCEAE